MAVLMGGVVALIAAVLWIAEKAADQYEAAERRKAAERDERRGRPWRS